jgi:transposase InsO family protein
MGRQEEGPAALHGARAWLQLRREGVEVARCTVERLMRELGIAGAASARKKPRATVPDGTSTRPADLLERDFTAPAPNRPLDHGYHLRGHGLRVRVHRIRHRLVLPQDRRLASR